MTRAVSHRWRRGERKLKHEHTCISVKQTDMMIARHLESAVLLLGDGPHFSPKVSLSPWQQPIVPEAKDAPPRVHHQALCWQGQLSGTQLLIGSSQVTKSAIRQPLGNEMDLIGWHPYLFLNILMKSRLYDTFDQIHNYLHMLINLMKPADP